MTRKARSPGHGSGGCPDRISQVYREIRSLQQRLFRLPRDSPEAGEVQERLDRLIVEYLKLQESNGEL